MPHSAAIPFWFKIAYTAFVIVLVPLNVAGYEITNLLWFSNVAMIATLLTIWLEWRLLATMMAVGVAALEFIWTLDFFAGLALGGEAPIGLVAYMFDERIDLHLRLLSLYHIPLPWILLWLVWRLGFDDRGWWAQTLLAWAVLVVSYFITDPENNVNWVFGLGEEPQEVMPSWLYLILLMLAYPLVIFLPSHFIIRWAMRKLPRPRGRESSP